MPATFNSHELNDSADAVAFQAAKFFRQKGSVPLKSLRTDRRAQCRRYSTRHPGAAPYDAVSQWGPIALPDR